MAIDMRSWPIRLQRGKRRGGPRGKGLPMHMRKNGRCKVHAAFSTATCAHCWSPEQSRCVATRRCFCEALMSAQPGPTWPAPLHLRELSWRVSSGSRGVFLWKICPNCAVLTLVHPKEGSWGRSSQWTAQWGGKQPIRVHQLLPVSIAASRVSVGSQGAPRAGQDAAGRLLRLASVGLEAAGSGQYPQRSPEPAEEQEATASWGQMPGAPPARQSSP